MDTIQERINVLAEQAREHIKTYGLHLTGVFGDEDNPPFTYSAGFYKIGKPEIMMFGIDGRVAMPIINDVYDRVKDGWQLPIERRIPELIKGFDVIALRVKPEVYRRGGVFPISMANRLAGEEGFPTPTALVLIWPDRSNVFPWEKGFDGKFKGHQPEVWTRSQ